MRVGLAYVLDEQAPDSSNHCGPRYDRLLQALIDLVDQDGDGVIEYEEVCHHNNATTARLTAIAAFLSLDATVVQPGLTALFFVQFAAALGSHMRSEEFHDTPGHHVAAPHQ